MKRIRYPIISLFIVCGFFKIIFVNDAFASKEVQELKKILIYSDLGTHNECVNQTKKTLQASLGPQYEIQTISKNFLLTTDWQSSTALLVMPGGEDTSYTKALNGEGNKKIKAFVEAGGSYLGICAGSYYAGKSVEFFKGHSKLEIIGERELSFFPGTVAGPTFQEFDYHSEKGSLATPIVWDASPLFKTKKYLKVYYQGGGYFLDADQHENIQILAYYEDSDSPQPAIIECQVGQGKAILSGVHFEFNPDDFDPFNPHLSSLISILRDENKSRLLFVNHILERLGLTLQKDLSPLTVSAPLPARVVSILTQTGNSVQKGTPLLSLEVMKMHLTVPASYAGKIKRILVETNQEVHLGQQLVDIEPE